MNDGRGTAADQLVRLLQLLPAASDRPLSVTEAAEMLDVSPRTVLEDIATITAREYYHPAGVAETLRIEVEDRLIRVVSHGKFDRPVRLNARESLATHLALRRFAASADDATRVRLLDLAKRIGDHLTSAEPDELVERFSVEESGESAGILLALRRATRDRRRCRIVYVRADGGESTHRTLDPYAVRSSHGTLFAVGHCGLRRDVRVFRVDRILDLELTEERFDVPADFEVDDWVEDGRVFRADETEPVTVRYTGLAASLIAERGPVEPAGEGVRVTYEVADSQWIVRHVLQRGGEAEVLEPEHVRREVAQAATRAATVGGLPPD